MSILGVLYITNYALIFGHNLKVSQVGKIAKKKSPIIIIPESVLNYNQILDVFPN